MSYLVLARRYRPMIFDDVVGQRHVTTTLKNALKRGKLAHALLFSGPRGVGKTTVARILARAINCPNVSEDFNPCNRCEICTEIITGSSVDVNEIDGASNRGIEEVRQLKEDIKFYPARAKKKVIIIDEVHMLTKEAFNALLKTIEEPPPYVSFIFATTEAYKIPNTILSRCQRYDFKLISKSELMSHLKSISEKEGINLTDNAILLIIKESGGSLRDALSILDKVIAFGATNEETVAEVLGISPISQTINVLNSILEKNTGKILETIDNLVSFGVDINKFINDLILIFKDVLILKISKDRYTDCTFLNSVNIHDITNALNDISIPDLILMTELLIQGAKELQRSIVPRITLEILLLKLCHINDFIFVEKAIEHTLDETLKNDSVDLMTSISSISNKTTQNIQKDETVSTNINKNLRKTHEKKEQKSEEKTRDLRGFINYTQKISPIFYSQLLQNEKSISFDLQEGIFEIRTENDFFLDMINDRENYEKLQEIVKEYFRNDKIKLSVVAKNSHKTNNDNPQNEFSLIHNNEFVKRALNYFNAKIVCIKNIEKNGDENYSMFNQQGET